MKRFYILPQLELCLITLQPLHIKELLFVDSL